MKHEESAVHPAARMYAEECREGKLGRREFLARSTALGVSATAAYGLIGARQPAQAQAQPREGGTIRCQMSVRALKGTRTAECS